jgi:hypothetical protein
MKRVTSVSLGSASRDKSTTAELLGEEFLIERTSVGGDIEAYRRKLQELDGKVDVLGLGGVDLYFYSAGRRYTVRQIAEIASVVKKTPVVDGSGLKNTLERETVKILQREGIVDFAHSKVLMVCAVDRFGMAEAIAETGASVVYGDLLFGVGLPIPIRSLAALHTAARALLPIIVQLPQQWLYPTGEKQTKITPKWGKYYAAADIIAGDFHFIRRFMPDSLPGKIIVTNTTTAADEAELKKRGVKMLITTTPVIDGRSFATNVWQGVLVALSGRTPDELKPEDYLALLGKLNWRPRVEVLNR